MSGPCHLCPRECGVDRSVSRGFCGAGEKPRIAKVMLHTWEEPCLVWDKGCGAVFFSSCPLQCLYCQNHAISFSDTGKEFDEKSLCEIFFFLKEKGACAIDLVTPTPHLETLIPALERAKTEGLELPVIYNCGGYESAFQLRRLDRLVDVYLTDFKYDDPALSQALSSAPDYAERAEEALVEMLRQRGKPRFDGERLFSGVIVRHLVLPSYTTDSVAVLERIDRSVGAENVILSLMSQYLPLHRAREHTAIHRPLTRLEYQRVAKKAAELPFSLIYTQEKDSASSEYVPNFSTFWEEKN